MSIKNRLAKLEQSISRPFVDEPIIFSDDPIKAVNQYSELIRRPYKLPKVAAADVAITPEEARAAYDRIMN